MKKSEKAEIIQKLKLEDGSLGLHLEDP